MAPKRTLITAALPYANGAIHFGHVAGNFLPADCYARFARLVGDDVLYLCGSDEYGVAITLSAELAGRTPQEQVDLFHGINKALLAQLNISFDHYSRTTWPGHKETTQQFFLDLWEGGYIEERETLQLYSEAEKRFLADRYVVGSCPKCRFEKARGDECPKCGASYEATDLISPRSKMTGSPLTGKLTKHFFLRFDKFRERLAEWLAQKQWKPNVLNFAANYIDELKPRAISRDSDWGVPVPLPDTEGKVLYVWFDAPIGYISAAREWALQKGEPDAWKRYWLEPETELVQFLGKDNIPFHAVFFPAMEMGQKLPYKLVDQLPANEFYNLEGRQFSKSDGWYVDLAEFLKRFGTEQLRYCIAANAPETQDSEFTWADFQMRCNSELLGKWGNFIHRVLTFIQSRTGGKVPPKGELEEVDQKFLARLDEIVREIASAYSSFSLRRATQKIMEMAQEANSYFDLKKPWHKAKQTETLPDMERTLYCCVQAIQKLAIISSPILPESSQRALKLLGDNRSIGELLWERDLASAVPEGRNLPTPEVIFTKIEDAVIQEEQAKLDALSQQQQQPPEVSYQPLKEPVNFDEVQKLDLRIGQIKSVERITKSKKLLKLTVDLGFETRTIVAGIGAAITDIEKLVGMKVTIVANLKPATLMGVESQGMLLAAEWQGTLELPSFSQLPPGSAIG